MQNGDTQHSTMSTAMVGAGVLSLPSMSQLGWVPGVVILILSCVITLFTLWQMVPMHEMSVWTWSLEGNLYRKFMT
ncbi:Amino acid transporter, transmembrane domain containing protein [Parasponia andersonii]|uniref:Amino acid transporter, transmembrane domain containing protein n=1 Tax=Parasponia andersonii TaxID=3476 RepID=A0A2P5B5E6_PARAD|nr:Amino acid transporter, transmembrane domain containing protein [Parasponia andersonii]